MNIADVCDVVYVLVVEKLEQDVRTERAALAAVGGPGEDGQWPDVDEARSTFDAALLDPLFDPALLDDSPQARERRELLEVLGLSGGRGDAR